MGLILLSLGSVVKFPMNFMKLGLTIKADFQICALVAQFYSILLQHNEWSQEVV